MRTSVTCGYDRGHEYSRRPGRGVCVLFVCVSELRRIIRRLIGVTFGCARCCKKRYGKRLPCHRRDARSRRTCKTPSTRTAAAAHYQPPLQPARARKHSSRHRRQHHRTSYRQNDYQALSPGTQHAGALAFAYVALSRRTSLSPTPLLLDVIQNVLAPAISHVYYVVRFSPLNQLASYPSGMLGGACRLYHFRIIVGLSHRTHTVRLYSV